LTKNKKKRKIMLEVLEFIFSSFWHWAGFTIILVIIAAAVIDVFQTIISAIKRK